jgi:hypothetical protein
MNKKNGIVILFSCLYFSIGFGGQEIHFEVTCFPMVWKASLDDLEKATAKLKLLGLNKFFGMSAPIIIEPYYKTRSGELVLCHKENPIELQEIINNNPNLSDDQKKELINQPPFPEFLPLSYFTPVAGGKLSTKIRVKGPLYGDREIVLKLTMQDGNLVYLAPLAIALSCVGVMVALVFLWKRLQ